MLMKAGESKAALGRVRETVAANPSDPAAHELLALVLDKSGFAEDAKVELKKAELLLHSQPLPNPASFGQQNQAPPPVIVAPAPEAGATPDSEVVSPTEKETKPPEQPVDSDVMKQ
jgi:hypothetical protein